MQPPKPRTRWTLAIVSLALFMVVLDNLIVTVALPSIQADLGATLQQLEWTVNAYTLAFAVTLIPGAALGDRFGRKRTFLAGLALFTASSAAAALAPALRELVAARALQGIGGAIVAPLTPDPPRRGVPAERARRRAGHLVGHQRPGHRARPARRRRGRRRPLVAVDLLDQRPARPRSCSRSPRSSCARAAARRPASTCRGSALVTTGLFALVYGLVRGQHRRLDQSADRREPYRAARRSSRCSSLMRRRTEAPMLPLDLFRKRAFAVTTPCRSSCTSGPSARSS